jgi:hypothetical protein
MSELEKLRRLKEKAIAWREARKAFYKAQDTSGPVDQAIAMRVDMERFYDFADALDATEKP